MKTRISKGFKFLMNPKMEFSKLQKVTLEESLENFIKLVLLSGLIAAIVNFLYRLVRAAFFDIFQGVSVNYIHLINFTLSVSSGIFFFYLFMGTFGVGILSLVINPFFKIKYTELVKIITYSLLPVILLGWISMGIAVSLLIWSLFLFIIAIK